LSARRIAFAGSTELSERLRYYFESTGFGETVGMFDDFLALGTIKHDRPILGKIADIPQLFKKGAFDSVAIAVGYNHRKFRKEVYQFLKENGIPVATFIHPSAHVEKSAVIKEGSIVLVGCTIDMRAELHENVFLSSRCFVSHDVRIQAHTYCGPAVILAGLTVIGECCFVGIGTTTIDRVIVGMNVQTAAGAVITKNVPPHVLVAGVPAKVKKGISF
jgi:sugar O-acyltransferase (sialic acid O-acetyltransferase NeuD family)